ncbi:MAG: lipase maturation factor family protein [Candidatus Omnitrophica bacterium]|nr:lipase maturation factor family protein [Candidatus Omnitrophota bacterium]
METYFGDFQLGRLIFLRSLAALYLVAFMAALNQFPVLLGEHGFLPIPEFIKNVPFRAAPSLFYLSYSDRVFILVAWSGIALSSITLAGLAEKGPWWISLAVWLVLWVLYLSIVNVGQVFYRFGWETMLLEAGFFAAFMGSSRIMPSLIPILILRWMLFRVELGSGLIKLRGDECWRNLTCLIYHHETQPIPNPLSWYFHHLPHFVHRFGSLFSHFVQLVAPFGLFAPQAIAAFAGGLIIFHQLLLIASGNYSWLNWLTVVLGMTAFSDAIVKRIFPFELPATESRPPFFNQVLYVLVGVTLLLSILPTLNFFSRRQLMNASFNPIHLVNVYGAFGTVTKERYEIVLEGTEEAVLTEETKWKAYEFKGKPGNVKRLPPQIAPYHLRLDWLMWFLPFRVRVTENGLLNPGYELWFLRFSEKLLEGDPKTLQLLRGNPFKGEPPRFVRALFYRYQFTDFEERRRTGAWWKRALVGEYLPPIALSRLQNILAQEG